MSEGSSDQARRFCGNCGVAAEPDKSFCTSCGERLSPDPGAPSNAQAIPREEVLRARRKHLGDSSDQAEPSPVRRLFPVVALGGAAVLVMLFAATVAFPMVRDQFFATPSLDEPASDPPPAGTTGRPEEPGEARRQPEPTSEEPRQDEPQPTPEYGPPAATPASVAPDVLPDPVFDEILPYLRRATDAPIILPADWPEELEDVAIHNVTEPTREGYDILILAGPAEGVVEDYMGAKNAGYLTSSPEPPEDHSKYAQVGYRETVLLPDGTEAELSFLEPHTGNYGPHWVGRFQKHGRWYTVTVRNPDPNNDAARRILASMVEAPPAPPTTSANVSPDASPDPAFDRLLEELHLSTTGTVMLPAVLPDELGNVAIRTGLNPGGSNNYGIVSMSSPTDDVYQFPDPATELGRIGGGPMPLYGLRSSNEPVESVETVLLPDGTEAELRYTVSQGEGAQWEGHYVRDDYGYHIGTDAATDPDGSMARQMLSTMVEVPEDLSPEFRAAQEAELRTAVLDYYDAVDRQDWAYTYDNLVHVSMIEFADEEDWSLRNEWYEENYPSDMTSVDTEILGYVDDNPAHAEVAVYRTFDGSGEVQTRNTVFINQDGVWKHKLVGEEIDLFRPDLSYEEFVEVKEGGGNAGGSEEFWVGYRAELVAAVEDYYEAVNRGDWGYTYDNLDSETQPLFTRDEWYQKNQWYDDNGGYANLVGVDVEITYLPADGPGGFAEVTVTRTYDSGYVDVRDTVFVEEGGGWKHRFVEEEMDLFRPDLSFEEFVEVKGG